MSHYRLGVNSALTNKQTNKRCLILSVPETSLFHHPPIGSNPHCATNIPHLGYIFNQPDINCGGQWWPTGGGGINLSMPSGCEGVGDCGDSKWRSKHNSEMTGIWSCHCGVNLSGRLQLIPHTRGPESPRRSTGLLANTSTAPRYDGAGKCVTRSLACERVRARGGDEGPGMWGTGERVSESEAPGSELYSPITALIPLLCPQLWMETDARGIAGSRLTNGSEAWLHRTPAALRSALLPERDGNKSPPVLGKASTCGPILSSS